MLPLVETPVQKLKKYEGMVSDALLKEIGRLAFDLKNLKVNMVNSTPRGGGVAEILGSLVSLMKGVGIQAEWHTIPPQNSFFEITKKMHNALQGKEYKFSFAARKKYIIYISRAAKLMREMKPDIWVIHDPQPAGVIMFLPEFHPSISHIHIDLTSPNPDMWKFVSTFLRNYDRVIVSSPDFIKKEIQDRTEVFQPAIDPFNVKNQPISPQEADEILRNFGINPDRPIIAQVSRFDPWKDPLGVIEAYRLAKKKIPELQLILVGFMLAQDDPEAEKIYQKIKKKTEKDADIFLFADTAKIGSLSVDVFVNAIQVGADIILQKSIREGFGMTVAEAMWKEKTVIAGNVGGIKTLIKNGENGFLVSNPEEAALKIIQLIEDPSLCGKIGLEAKKTIQENFLMPRLLRDYLRLFKEMRKN